MNRRHRVIVNFVAMQAGWFICVMGAAAESFVVGPVFVAAHLLLHFFLTPDRVRDVFVLLVAGILGIVADGTLMQLGAIAFDSGVIGGWIAPLWMIALWVNFATSLNLTLEFLHGRYVLSVLFGAFGGAAAYVGGARLEALSMPPGMWRGGAAVAVVWAVATPVLVWMSARFAQRFIRGKGDGAASDTVAA
ncbi:MAG: DUF2878 domain-containing protein [Phycisphaerales bacterium]|nr:DUF2878 domain-containing protein [Phycisphaerales bacterium]